MNVERKLPPTDLLCVAILALIVVSGIYIAAKLPREVPLELPIVLTAIAGVALLLNLVMLSQTKGFAWSYFKLVGGWTLVAYGAIAGMLEYSFIRNDTPDKVMVLLTVQLAIFAVNIATLMGFSVARYQEVGASEPA